MIRTIASLTAIGLAGCTTATPINSQPDFRETVKRHMAAVPGRDMDVLVDTITTGETLLLIFPDGTTFTTRTEFLDFHREWFAETSWTFTSEILSLDERAGYGKALTRYAFDPDGPQGETPPRSSLLTLGFALENGQWRLVHDQNTRLEQ